MAVCILTLWQLCVPKPKKSYLSNVSSTLSFAQISTESKPFRLVRLYIDIQHKLHFKLGVVLCNKIRVRYFIKRKKKNLVGFPSFKELWDI